jgi:hypothetical protein
VTSEVLDKCERLKVQRFAFVEHGIAAAHAELFGDILEWLARRDLKVAFYALVLQRRFLDSACYHIS